MTPNELLKKYFTEKEIAVINKEDLKFSEKNIESDVKRLVSEGYKEDKAYLIVDATIGRAVEKQLYKRKQAGK